MNKNEVLTEADIRKVYAFVPFRDGESTANYIDFAKAVIEAYRAKLTAGVELPPLPEPVGKVMNYPGKWEDGFCADQVREAQLQAIACDRARLAGRGAVAYVEGWREGAKFALREVAKCDVAFLTDSMKEVAIKLAADACAKERDRLQVAPVPAQAEKVEPGAVADAFDSIRIGLDAISKGGEPRINAAIATALKAQISMLEKLYTTPSSPKSLLDAAETGLETLEEIDGAVLGILGLIVGHPEKDAPADKVRSAILKLRAALQEHGRKV